MAIPTISNFSVSAGDNAVLSFEAETGEVNLNDAEVSWALYAQDEGAPTGDAIIEKLLSYGVTAESDGDITSFEIELEVADTIELALGNYYHEAILVDGNGKNLTVAIGILTLTGWSSELTSRSLKLRFPELVDIDDWALEFAIAEATLRVDSSWIAKDISKARALLAAHIATAAGMDLETGGDATITSELMGRISVSYARSGASERSALLGATTYGQRFLALMAGSHRGPIIV